MALALDEPKENDQTFSIDGITFLIDKDLMEEVKPIKVNFVEKGFRKQFAITSKLSKKGGSCGSNNCCGE